MSTIEYTLHEAARYWLGLGFNLLPIQAGTKYMVKGWGINLRRITTIQEAHANLTPGANVAVVCNGDNFVLDFDNWDLYMSWLRVVPERYTTSYTEFTRRGAHVWLCGDVVAGMRLVDGVEVKRISIVAPSVVDGFAYERGLGQIYSGDVDEAFTGLTRPGTPTAYRLRAVALDAVQTPSRRPTTSGAITADKVQLVKKSWHVLDVFTKYSPTKNTLRGSGRWFTACCPFHGDSNPSMWLDAERGLWGCHGCKEHGDSINLYAGLRRLSVGDAIRAMASEVSQ